MDNGIVEHEVCPVVVGRLDGEPRWTPPRSMTPVGRLGGATCTCSRRAAVAQPVVGRPDRRAGSLATSPRDWRALVPTVPGSNTPSMPCRAVSRRVAQRSAGPVQDRPSGCSPFPRGQMAELVASTPASATRRGDRRPDRRRRKRLRPAFVYWGHRAAGGADEPAAAHVGAAVEMLHTFALLHDDVMDRAPHTRGRPPPARAFAHRHATTAAGDAELVRHERSDPRRRSRLRVGGPACSTAPAAAAALPGSGRSFTTLRVEVMAGQYLDLRLDGATAADPDGRPPRRAAEVRALHRDPPAAARAGHALAGVGPTRDGTRPGRRTATPSASPSRCATTSSGCSATRRRPARAA